METVVLLWLSSRKMDTVTRDQVLNRVSNISHSFNTLGENMNPTMGKYQGRLGSLTL